MAATANPMLLSALLPLTRARVLMPRARARDDLDAFRRLRLVLMARRRAPGGTGRVPTVILRFGVEVQLESDVKETGKHDQRPHHHPLLPIRSFWPQV